MATVKTLIGNVRGPAGPAPTVKSTTRKSGDHTPGTDDTYRVEFDNGSAFEFPVYNGLNGEGSVKTVNGVHADSNGNVDLNDKQPLVVGKAGGSDTLVLEHSGKGPLLGLTMYGKSTQDGTPTPDNPVPIQSVENPVVTVGGEYVSVNGRDVIIGTNWILQAANNRAILNIPCKPNTQYTLYRSDVPTNITDIAVVIKSSETATSKIGDTLSLRDNDALEFQTPANATCLCIQFASSGTITESMFDGFVLSVNGTIQQATLDLTLRSVGNVRDELTVYADGTGEITRRIGVCNSWTKQTDFTNCTRYSGADGKAVNNGTQWLCNITDDKSCEYSEDKPHVYYWNALYMFAPKGLDPNTVVVIYNLTTPTTETLSASQVQAVLALNTVTPTSVITNDQGAEMAVTYVGEGGAGIVDVALSETEKRLLLAAHPVGSLYWSSVATDPGTLFGGTWARIKDKFILAAGDSYAAGSKGGEATHVLTTNEMPSHDHAIDMWLFNGVASSGVHYGIGHQANDGIPATYNNAYGSGDIPWGTAETGGGAAHNNMPPYETYYCWRRTA